MKAMLIAVLVCILLELGINASYAANTTVAAIIENIFDGYDKKRPPNHNKVGSEKQVLVTVNMYVNSMYEISEMDMDFSMSIFLRERWVDERLMYDQALGVTRIILDNSMFGDIWMPDVYILNEKASDFHEVMIPNKLIHIYPDGTVQHSARVTGKFSCRMYLQKYPFDTQYCNFEVESYFSKTRKQLLDGMWVCGRLSQHIERLLTNVAHVYILDGHSTEDLKLVWSENAVSMAENIEFPQFSIIKIKSYSCEKDYYGIIYPCIGMAFALKRNYAYYIIQIYVPSLLIVVLSWVSFWLDPTSVPARISLGLLTVLTMTTQSAGARANLPRVSYVKAIDVFMATCITFVFLALVEFALVNVLTRTDDKRKEETLEKGKTKGKLTKVNPVSDVSDEDVSVAESISSKKRRMEGFRSFFKNLKPDLVDKLSRILFPFAFAIFNLVYWIHYFFFDRRFEDMI